MACFAYNIDFNDLLRNTIREMNMASSWRFKTFTSAGQLRTGEKVSITKNNGLFFQKHTSSPLSHSLQRSVAAKQAGASFLPITEDHSTEELELKIKRVFGEYLRYRRMQRRLSFRALSASSGLSVNQLFRLEAGRTDPTLIALVKLSRAFGEPFHQFILKSHLRSYL
jgi:hypothetical protein